MKNKRPDSVKIGQYTMTFAYDNKYLASVEKENGSPVDAATDMRDQRVVLRHGGDDYEKECTLHEIVHLLLALTGASNFINDVHNEEVIVSSISPLLLDFICNNQDYINYLIGE